MIQRNLMERFCIYWWTDEEFGEDWVQHQAKLLGWPVPIEIDNVELWNGGGA